jgi:hypothetical protein
MYVVVHRRAEEGNKKKVAPTYIIVRRLFAA